MKQQPEISTATKLCAVIGNPVSHSLSPAIHNAGFRELGLDFVYTAFRIEQPNAILSAMRTMDNFRGLSVTIPHKMAIVELVDTISELDRQIGSINTVIQQDGNLHGVGTDGAGALKALQESGTQLSAKQLLIIGAGGASRAICYALLNHTKMSRFAIYDPAINSTALLAKDLANYFSCSIEVVNEQHQLSEEAANADIIINTSPVGMYPNISATPLPKAKFNSAQTCFDIIYTPRMTQFLQSAQECGAKVISGVEMFIYQAALQFELFTGVEAPVSVMRSLIEQRSQL